MKHIKNVKNKVICLFVIFLLVGFVIPGCGKKGPPEMIKKAEDKLKSVENLTYKIQADNIVLAWEANYNKNEMKSIDGFEIFMAKQNIKKCQGCPKVFQRVDLLPSDQNQYQAKLDKGYRYFFKVRTVTVDNIKSDYAETDEIQFD